MLFDARSVFRSKKGAPADYMRYARSLKWEELISKSQEVLRSTMEERENVECKNSYESLENLEELENICVKERGYSIREVGEHLIYK